jgi:hypothetical protein
LQDQAVVANDEPQVRFVDVGQVEVDEDVPASCPQGRLDAQSKLGTQIHLAACPDKDQAEQNLHGCSFVNIVVVQSAWASLLIAYTNARLKHQLRYLEGAVRNKSKIFISRPKRIELRGSKIFLAEIIFFFRTFLDLQALC